MLALLDLLVFVRLCLAEEAKRFKSLSDEDEVAEGDDGDDGDDGDKALL